MHSTNKRKGFKFLFDLRVGGSGFRAWGLGFRVQGLGFRAWGSIDSSSSVSSFRRWSENSKRQAS